MYYDADFGDEEHGVTLERCSELAELYVWEDGEGHASYYLNKIEGAALRDALDRWINEGGK